MCSSVAAAAIFLLVALGGASTASAQPLPYQCELRPPPYGPSPSGCAQALAPDIAPVTCTGSTVPDPVICADELLESIPSPSVPPECRLRPPPYPQPSPFQCLVVAVGPIPANPVLCTVDPAYSTCDRDGDGVANESDQCPTQHGGGHPTGCPDSDGDGVLNRDDDCPYEPGSAGGCPDRDKDGTADRDDECPDAAGPASLRGCPPPAAEPPPEDDPTEQESTYTTTDGDAWNGDPNETHDNTERGADGWTGYESSGLRCAPDDQTWGAVIFEHENLVPGAPPTPHELSSRAALGALLASPAMPVALPGPAFELRRSPTGGDRYVLTRDGDARIIVDVEQGTDLGWEVRRMLFCSAELPYEPEPQLPR